MDESAAATTKRMRLRYAGACRGCGVKVSAGVVAVYDRVARKVTCMGCTNNELVSPAPVSAALPMVPEPVREDGSEVVVAVAGASARREYERRKVNDERQLAEWQDMVRSRHPHLGRLILAAAMSRKGRRPTHGSLAPTGRKCSPGR